MTVNLLASLEEKMVTVLAKMEELRKEVHRLTDENAVLKMEKEVGMKKLHDLISLLDALDNAENIAAANAA